MQADPTPGRGAPDRRYAKGGAGRRAGCRRGPRTAKRVRRSGLAAAWRDAMRPLAEFAQIAMQDQAAYLEEWERESKESADWQRVPSRSVDVVPAQTLDDLRGVERELAAITGRVTRLTFRVASSRESGRPPGYVHLGARACPNRGLALPRPPVPEGNPPTGPRSSFLLRDGVRSRQDPASPRPRSQPRRIFFDRTRGTLASRPSSPTRSWPPDPGTRLVGHPARPGSAARWSFRETWVLTAAWASGPLRYLPERRNRAAVGRSGGP